MLVSANEVAGVTDVFTWLPAMALGWVCILYAAVNISLGMVFLLYGYRACRWLIPIFCAVIGSLVGCGVAAKYEFNLLLGTVVGAIVLGIIGWTLYKIVCCALGGLLAAIILTLMWPDVADRAGPYVWAVWGAAFAVGFVLVLVLFRPLLIIVTSVYGAACVVLGMLPLAMLWPAVSEPVMNFWVSQPWVLVVLVVAPAVVGAVLQFLDPAAKEGAAKPAKKKPAAMKEEAEE